MTWYADSKLLSLSTGIAAAMNAIIEALVADRAVDQDRLIGLLQSKLDELRQDPDPVSRDAAFFVDQILRPLISEERRQTRKLLNDPPEGKA